MRAANGPLLGLNGTGLQLRRGNKTRVSSLPIRRMPHGAVALFFAWVSWPPAAYPCVS